MEDRCNERHQNKNVTLVLDNLFNQIRVKMSKAVGSMIVTSAIFLLGITMKGEWIIILASGMAEKFGNASASPISFVKETFGELDFIQLLQCYIGFLIPSFIIYFGVSGFLHWYFYRRCKGCPHEWKCQPTRWLSPELEREEILIGSMNMALGNLVSSSIAYYIINGGTRTGLYFEIHQYGWIWFVLQWPVIFVFTEFLVYWQHRCFHLPFIYKSVHKLHHRYKQPTAFSSVAMHPIEFFTLQSIVLLPLFLLPVHWVPYLTIVTYDFYQGMLDHSGIDFKPHWWQPWQPGTMFHDNHHQYFHVNFALNMSCLDKIFGTYRLKDRIYGEDIFYGKGKPLSEATVEEKKRFLINEE